MLPLIPLLTSLLPKVIETVVGKKDNETGKQIIKGLIKSKTSNYNHVLLLASAIAIFSAPVSVVVQWVIFGALVVNWGVSQYLRIVTKDKVGK